MKKVKPRTWYGKLWYFVWHEDSLLAWVVNVILAFILIKFILYPGLGLVMGTELPVVAVVSSSMDHSPVNGELCGADVEDASYWSVCGEWYEDKNITFEEFNDFIFSNGFWKGDVMILWRSNPGNTDVGDVIVFTENKQYPIIHRVINTYKENGNIFYVTKGDHNKDSISEYVVRDAGYFYSCYQDRENGILPSLCSQGTKKVTSETPGAIRVMDETRVPQNLVIGKAVGRIPFAGWLKIGFVNILSSIGLDRAIEVVSV